MLTFVLRRCLFVLGVFLLCTLLLWFFGIHIGSPALPYPGARDNYVIWLGTLAHGQWGTYVTRTGTHSFTDLFRQALPFSVALVVPAIALYLVLVLLLGMYAATRPHAWPSRILSQGIFVLGSLPEFWLGLMSVEIFAVLVHWFPYPGIVDVRQAGGDYGTVAYQQWSQAHPMPALLDLAHHYILPILVLVLIAVPKSLFVLRNALLGVLEQDYIRAARARGIPQRRLLWRHALRNAALPTLTQVGLTLPQLFVFSAIIEYIFQIPGIGRIFCVNVVNQTYINQALPYKSLQFIIVFILLYIVITLATTLLVDLCYALVQPRIAQAGAGG